MYVCTCAFITYLFVCMCVCLSTMTYMWESEDDFRVSSLLPSCGFWGLSSGHRPGGIRLSHFTSPEIVFSDNFLCNPGWPQAHYMVDAVYELLILVPRPPKCWDYTLVLWWPAEASYFWRIFFSFDTAQLSRRLGYRMILQCSVLRVCTLVISDILHVFVWAIFKNPFY